MTANAMVGDRDKVLAAGMNDHIAKPIKLDEMFATLARWVRPAAARTSESSPARPTSVRTPIRSPTCPASTRASGWFETEEPAAQLAPPACAEPKERYSAARTLLRIQSVKPATSGLSPTSWRHTR